LRLARLRGASVNVLANCLALISMFNCKFKWEVQFNIFRNYHIWYHHRNLPTWIGRLVDGLERSHRRTASKSPKNNLALQHEWVQPRWAHTPMLVLWFLIHIYKVHGITMISWWREIAS
jgi:hypothetical protein